MTEKNELLPCPFCASTGIDAEGWSCSDGRKGPACDSCGASADSEEAWNRRAPLAPDSADVTGLPLGTLGGVCEALEEIERAMNGTGPLSREDDSDTIDQIGLRARQLLKALHALPVQPQPSAVREALAQMTALFEMDDEANTPGTDSYAVLKMARAALSEQSASALPAAPSASQTRPTDALWDQTLRERDRYHEAADELAQAIAEHLGVEIGEHSNCNCPWQNALEHIQSAAPSAGQEATDKVLEEVAAERRRQIEVEGNAPEQDDGYTMAERVRAAVSYIKGFPEAWPWGAKWWKPKDPRRDLIRAIALLTAEIERLDRVAAPSAAEVR